MITIICGTNRVDNKSIHFANYFYQMFKEQANEEVFLIDLAAMDMDLLKEGMYTADGQSPALATLQDQCLIPANKFFFVFPEYNGSFPGILKLFIDAISIRAYKETFVGKKAGLAGVASGRAGNLRGMDHLTGVLHHVGTQVMPKMLPISSISSVLNEQNEIADEVKTAMKAFATAFLDF